MSPLSHVLASPGQVAIAGRRIALFAGAYNHISDGVALTLNRLVRYLERRGAEVLVFAPTSNRPPAIEHEGTLVSVPSIPFPGRSDYRLTLRLSRKCWTRLESFDPHLVHIATPDYAGAQALKWAKTQDVPVVASFHTHFAAYLKYFASYNPLYRMELLENTAWRYGRWFYPQCAHIYVPSPTIATELRAQGITRGLRIWARGVDAERFKPQWRSSAWRQQHGMLDDEVLITYVGRLVWEKGLYVFAEVVEGLRSAGVPHRSMIVGDGPAKDTLQERLPHTCFTGPLSGDALCMAYSSSDLFLFPSDTETFGNVTLEAMASGLPVVAADAAGSDFLVVHGETGFLARPGESESFLAHVRQLAMHPSLRRRMGVAARKRALAFEWGQIMGSLAGYYNELWNGHPELNGKEVSTSRVQRAIA